MVLRGMSAKSNRRKLKIAASAADGGRPRLLYAVDDLNKLRMNSNRSPGRRRPNRAFPQNQADLDPHRQVALAMRHMQAQRHLTVPDSFALALAKRNGWTLLTGDGPLRELAKAEGVDCHGVLWLLDEFETQGAATFVQLHGGLERISAHPRCRLPRREIAIRLSRYAERL
jgi:hypothetical protein